MHLTAVADSGQKMVADTLRLMLKVLLNYLTGILGTEFESSERVATIFNCVISPAGIYDFKLHLKYSFYWIVEYFLNILELPFISFADKFFR